MPTKLRRIAVTVDSRLAAALEAARRELPGKSDAGLVKELALRGSRSGSDGTTNPALERILARPGVRLPERKLESVLAELGETQKFSSESIYKALEEERADRELF